MPYESSEIFVLDGGRCGEHDIARTEHMGEQREDSEEEAATHSDGMEERAREPPCWAG